MGEWAQDNVCFHDQPRTCMLALTGQWLVLPGSNVPLELKVMPGRFNVYVPHVPWEQLDERIHMSALGFLILHEAWRDSWLEEGAFGCPALPIKRSIAKLECSNYVLGFAEAGVSLAKEFVQEQDQLAARRLEVEVLRQMAYDIVADKDRRRLKSEEASLSYVSDTQCLAAFPVNQARSKLVFLDVYKMGDVVVRIECKFDMKGMRVFSGPIASPEFSKETLLWHERIGRSVYEDEFSTFVERLEDATSASPKRRSTKRVREKLKELRMALRAHTSDETEEEERPIISRPSVAITPMSALAQMYSAFWSNSASPMGEPSPMAPAHPGRTIFDEFAELEMK